MGAKVARSLEVVMAMDVKATVTRNSMLCDAIYT
jgi:hypothetical protein